MIRRLLCWLADWFADSEWLAKMREKEIEANQSAAQLEKRQNFLEVEILNGRQRNRGKS